VRLDHVASLIVNANHSNLNNLTGGRELECRHFI
jgi:hypothetical protein